jgi:hypothetical protein
MRQYGSFLNLAEVQNRWNFAKRRRGGEDKRIKVIQVKVMLAVGKVVFRQLAINVRLLQAVVGVAVRHIQMCKREPKVDEHVVHVDLTCI